MRRLRMQWSGGPDHLLTGLRYVVSFADVATPQPDRLRAVLATIAAAGPHTRIGLTPVAGRRWWRYDPASVPPVYEIPDALDGETDAAVVEHISRRPRPKHPLEVHVSPRRLVFDADHGLGDGRFTLDLAAAIFAASAGDPSTWISHGQTSLALPRAFLRTFGRRPRRVLGAWEYANRTRGSRQAPAVAPSPADSQEWTPSVAAAVARVEAKHEAAVEEWRRVNVPGVGSAAVWLMLVHRALRAEGLEAASDVIVAMDCRRYLTPGMNVNGNFIIGLRVALDEDSVTAAGASIEECTSSALSLAGLTAYSALSLIGAGKDNGAVSSVPKRPVANLTYSHMGTVRTLDDMPWGDLDNRGYVGILDPAAPESVTILNARIGNTRRVSISYHDNVFDRERMDRAAHALTNPLPLLSDS